MVVLPFFVLVLQLFFRPEAKVRVVSVFVIVGEVWLPSLVECCSNDAQLEVCRGFLVFCYGFLDCLELLYQLVVFAQFLAGILECLHSLRDRTFVLLLFLFCIYELEETVHPCGFLACWDLYLNYFFSMLLLLYQV